MAAAARLPPAAARQTRLAAPHLPLLTMLRTPPIQSRWRSRLVVSSAHSNNFSRAQATTSIHPAPSYPMALTSYRLAPPITALFVAGRQTSVEQPPAVLPMTPSRRSRSMRRPMRGGGVVAMADLLGDLGARDPFPEEIESNFCEKVLGDVDTLHRILVPTLSALSLTRLPLDPNPTPLAIDDARKLLLKVVGWRLLAKDEGCMRLQCLWKVRDETCGQELIARITTALDGAGHAPATLLFEPPNQVKAELYSPSIGGLSMNDFIIAARIDKVKTLDLVPKKRVWA